MSMKSVIRTSRYTGHGNVVATVSLSYFFVFSRFETEGRKCKNDSEEKTGVYVSGVKHTRNRKNENTIKKIEERNCFCSSYTGSFRKVR